MIFRILAGVSFLSKSVSAPTRFGWNRNSDHLQLYILAWTVALILVLAFAPLHGAWGYLFVALAFFRLQEFLLATLDDVLGLTSRAKDYRAQDPRFTLAITFFNILQVIVIFAIAFVALTGNSQVAFSSGGDIVTRFDYLYLSWATLLPLGSGHAPLTAMARALTIAEGSSGLVIVVLALAAYVGRPQDSKS